MANPKGIFEDEEVFRDEELTHRKFEHLTELMLLYRQAMGLC